jgi:excisionase family DNA binding protein
VHSESQARLGDSASSTPLLLTIPEVADELRVDKRTVYRLLRSGELDLPVIHVGSSPRVRRLDLEQHLARLAADEEEAAAARRDRAALLLRSRRRLPAGRR